MKTTHRTPEMYFYEWSVARWRASETRALLDSAGRSIYREMLDLCYVQGSIPKDHRILAIQCACTEAELEAVWPLVSRHFFTDKHDQNRLRNKFSDTVRANFSRFVVKQKENSKKGGQAKAKGVNGIPSGGSGGGSSSGGCLSNTTTTNTTKLTNTTTTVPLLLLPKTSAAIREWYPTGTDAFSRKLAAAVREVEPAATDEDIAFAVVQCRNKRQDSAGLFLQTIPSYFRNKQLSKPKQKLVKCRACSDTGILLPVQQPGESNTDWLDRIEGKSTPCSCGGKQA